MGIIGKLWVSLGLRDDEFSKGLNKAKSGTRSFANEAGRAVGEFAKKFLSVTAVFATVSKVIKDSVRMTQTWGDRWQQVMEGARDAYGVFIRQISSGEGWSNLLQNMSEAYVRGKEIAASLDEIFERKISFGYSEAEAENFIAKQQLIMRDSSKSDQERRAAAKAIIDKENELAGIKKGIWEQEARALRDRFQLQTRLGDDETDYLLKNYNLNRNAINEARAYGDELSKLQSLQTNYQIGGQFGGGLNNASYIAESGRAIADLEARTTDATKELWKLVQLYDRSNDQLVVDMAQAEVAVINVETEALRRQLRPTATLGSLGGDELVSQVENLNERLTATERGTFEDWERFYEAHAGRLAEFYRGELASIIAEMEDFDDALQSELDAATAMIADELTDRLSAGVVDLGSMLSSALDSAVQGVADSVQELMDALMGVSEFDSGAIWAALLEPLCQTAKSMGTIMMTMGAGLLAVEESLASLNPAVLLGAGAALVAIGAAGSAAIRSLSKGGTSTATTTTGSSSQSSTYTSELVVKVEGTIKGSDIVISGEKTLNNWGK